MTAIGTTHGHDSSTTILHRRLHITEVKIDTAFAMDGDEFRDTLYGIL